MLIYFPFYIRDHLHVATFLTSVRKTETNVPKDGVTMIIVGVVKLKISIAQCHFLQQDPT